MKNIRLFALAICLICLCGCREQRVSESFNQEMPTEESPKEQEPVVQEENLFFFRTPVGAQTENGFYSMQYHDDWTGFLTYSDYATQQTVPLCNQPNCEHHAASCTAWFENPYNIPRLIANDEKLVYCYLGMRGTYSEPAFLEIANLDGSERTTLYTLDANETLDEGFCIDDDAVSVLTRETESQNDGTVGTICKVIKINLYDQTETELWRQKQEGGVSYFLAGSMDGQIVLKEIRVEETSSQNIMEQVHSQRHTLYLISPQDGAIHEGYSWKQDANLEMAYANELFLVTDSHTLCQLTKEGDMIQLAESNILVPGKCSLQYANENSLWVTSTESIEGMPNPGVCLYQIDRESGTISELHLEDGVSVDVLAEYQNKLFVRISASRSQSQEQSAKYAFWSENTMQENAAEPNILYFKAADF